MAVPFIAPMGYGRAKEARPHRFAYDYGSVDPGMYAPAPDRSRPKRAPKRTLAYSIPLPESPDTDANSPGHVLGVNALAVSLSGNSGGTLFSGGRDGVVKAWDMNLPLISGAIDHEQARQRRPQTTQRATQTAHADWINDVVAVNAGQTAVTASSDKTVRAWTPGQRPQMVGSHMDYVKALAFSEHCGTVVSGGLDRRIKLWDVSETRSTPICALYDVGNALSIYALACNAQGSLVVSGSPEKAIRVWDPRSGRPLTSLAGHTDHIRAVLLSEDSELVLSGSSDSTVKLWSMRMRRCLSTYAQHSDSVWALCSGHPRFHTFYSGSRDGLVAKTVGVGDDAVCVAVAKESQGVVKLAAIGDAYIWTATKGTRLNRWLDVNVHAQQPTDGVTRESLIDAGQGLALDSEHSGHRRNRTLDSSSHVRPMSSASGTVSPVIMAMQAEQAHRNTVREADEDQFYDAQSRPGSGGEQRDGLASISSVLAASSDSQPHTSEPIEIPSGNKQSRPSESAESPSGAALESPLPSVSLIEGAASATSPAPMARQVAVPGQGVVPVRAEPDESISGRHGLHRHRVLPNRRHVLAQDTAGRISLWDIMLCRRTHEFPEAPDPASRYPTLYGRDFDAISAALSTDPESVNPWCYVDTRTGVLTVHLNELQVWDAEVHVDEVEGVLPEAIEAMGDHERVNVGQWMLKRLFLSYARARVKRGPMPAADAAALNRWAAQAPAAEIVPARSAQRPHAASAAPAIARSTPTAATLTDRKESEQPQPQLQQQEPAIISPLVATTAQIGIDAHVPAAPTSARKDRTGSSSSTSTDGHDPSPSQQPQPQPQPSRLPRHHHNPSIDTARSAAQTTAVPTPTTIPAKAEDAESAASNGSAGKFISRLRSMRVRKQKSTLATQIPPTPVPQQPASKEVPAVPSTLAPPPANSRSTSAPGVVAANAIPEPRDTFGEWAGPRYPTDTERTLALLQAPPAAWEQLYSAILCPRLPLPRNIDIMVLQDCPDASEPFVIFRSTISVLCDDAALPDGTLSVFRVLDDALLSFELCMPAWLADFLLLNRLPASFQEPAKISFVLSPAPGATLPPFPNPSARLVANRMLRARKLAIYVVDKLALPLMTQPAPNFVNAADACARTYLRDQTDGMLIDHVAVFEQAGETLSDAERMALEDVALWRRLRTAADKEAGEYIGRPELYLHLTCKNKSVPAKATLATIKASVWKANGDVVVHYEWADFVRRRIAKAQALAS